jgi:hypothetical protein
MENTEFQPTPIIPETPKISEPSLKTVESLPKPKNNWILIAIIAVLFVAVLYLLYFNFNKSPVTTSTSTPITGIIPTETVIPTAIPTTNPTVGWKTYTNSQYNLSFEYQPDQTVNENELNSTYGGKETVLSTKYNGYYFDLFIEENKNKVSFNTFLKDETNQIGFTSYTNKTIGKLNGDLAEIVGNKGTLDILYASLDFYMIDSNNHLYRFRLDTNDEMNVTNSDRQLFNQILSTFKFQ